MANNNHFELTLDTLAPSGSISGLNEFEKANKALTIDGGDATFKKVWFDGLDKDEVSKDCDGYKAAEWEAKDIAVTSAFNATGTYYYHLVLMDDVNNESEIYTLGPVNYDQDAPVVSNVIVKDSRGNTSNTNEVTLTLTFNYTDIGTKVQKAVISGDVEEKTIELIASNDSYEGTITLKAEADGKIIDGNKSVTVVAYDAADNASAPVTSNIILLDRELDKPTLLITNTESGTNLPEFINYQNFTAKLTSVEPNIVAYKIWEGDAAAGETVEWVAQEMGNLDVEVDMSFSDGDGLKTIRAAVKDVAGNVQTAEARTTTIDTVAPVAEITTDKAIISKVSGYDKAILTFGKTADNETGSGIEYYEIKRNGEKIDFGAAVPANYEVTVDTLADGIYTYTIMVRDKAQNVTESAATTVKIDTTVPTLSITQLNPWYTNKFDVNLTYSDASALASMSVWSSTVADDTTLPENKISIAPATTVSSANIAWNLAESEANYIHVMLVDEVGNTSFAHCQFGYDTVAPTILTCKFTEEAYPSVAATINLTYEDATSGVVEMRVSGDVTDGTAEGKWEPVVGTRNVTLTEKDGIKTVLVEIRDAAGLVTSKEITCELDTTIPMPVLNVFEADLATKKADNSAVASFGLKLEVVGADEAYEEDFTGGVEYLLYGDFNYGAQSEAGIAKDDAEWKPFVKDDGKVYMTISDLYCTAGDGTKKIYVIVKDNAGNTMALTDPKSFVYDTTAPVVAVSEIDFNRISKVNVERRNAAGIIVGKYADEVHFVLTPDSAIQAYKVCAYADASAAAAVTDVAAEVAIGKANGSIHMSDSGLKSADPISAMIKGADYEAALGGSDENPVDGAHIVVVYVQDLAGTWSVAAQF
jgi:hypothetical protein